MDEKKKIKICFAASSGGHYEQLMMLKPLMKKYDSFVITEKTDYSAESKGEKTYYMKQVNRREKDFISPAYQTGGKSAKGQCAGSAAGTNTQELIIRNERKVASLKRKLPFFNCLQ